MEPRNGIECREVTEARSGDHVNGNVGENRRGVTGTKGEARPPIKLTEDGRTCRDNAGETTGAPDWRGEQTGGEASNMRAGADALSGATPRPDEAEIIRPQPTHDPQITGYVENPLGAMLKYASVNALEIGEFSHPQNNVGLMIPKLNSPHIKKVTGQHT